MRFRHQLEKHALTLRIFEEINDSLAEQGLFMREGTILFSGSLDDNNIRLERGQ